MLLAPFNLTDAADRAIKTLSGVMRLRLDLAAALVHRPPVLVLDQPTTGLDPRSKREVQEVLASLRSEREVTVLLCTHDLAEAAALSDRVIMPDQGAALADGTPDELCARFAQPNLEEVFMHLSGKSLEEDEEEELVT